MTNQELISLAANAIGKKVPTKKDYPYAWIDETGIHTDVSCGGDGTDMRTWNPLESDRDAFQVAVKLGIQLQVMNSSDLVGRNRDLGAAQRRHIVEQAALIAQGKSIPPETIDDVKARLAEVERERDQAIELNHKLCHALREGKRTPLTADQLFADDNIMSLNASLGLTMPKIVSFVRAVEAAHGITEDCNQ